MAEEANYTASKPEEFNAGTATVETAETVETTDRGLFGFGKKKDETKPSEQEIAAAFHEKVQVSEPVQKEEKKGSLLSKLHRSGSSSSSSSSSDEEVEEGGEIIKRKKKKGLKEKITGKIHGDEEKKSEEVDTSVPIEKYEEVVAPPPSYQEPTPAAYQEPVEEKKGFLEKIKEKLPGGKKTEEEVVVTPPPPTPVVAAEHDTTTEVEAKEKKGIFEKIKEKLPGYHPKAEEEKKEEKKEGGSDY